jgi:succinate dehydrogenase / fumarate reductase flavoprotein subunit
VRPSAEGWSDLAQLIDLRAGLLVAEATLRGALARCETRGCHNRTDFPDLDPTINVNIHHCLADDGRLVDPWSEPVLPVRDELVPWLYEAGPANFEGRLLE